MKGGVKMKKYIATYKVEIEALDIAEARDLAEKGEIKINSRLEEIRAENGEVLEGVYNIE